MGLGKSLKKAAKSAVRVVAAPAKSTFAVARAVAAGDLKGAGKASISAVTGLNPLAQAEMLTGFSPTGFGQVASGDTSPEALKRWATSSAIGVGGAAFGAAGAMAAKAASSGNIIGAASSLSGVDGLPDLGSLGGLIPDGMKEYAGLAKSYLPALGSNGQARSPAALVNNVPVMQPENNSGPSPYLLLGAAAFAAFFLIKRRK